MMIRSSTSIAALSSLRVLSRTFAASAVQQGPPIVKHFKLSPDPHPLESPEAAHADRRDPMHRKDPQSYLLFQPIYTPEEVNRVEVTHVKPETIRDRVALAAISTIRLGFDLVTGYGRVKFDEDKYLQRIVFLETVAGVPGMVGGMHRHMKSLRTLRRDRGWVHTLLEECENERMHLLTFLKLKEPGPLFRFMVLGAQGVFFNLYFFFYLVAPRYCHRFVGYLEEEAVKTYTHILEDIDSGALPKWKSMPAPEIARSYWRLASDATMRDLVLAVRADEANHRDVNHVLSEIPQEDPNPFSPPPDEAFPQPA